ncbi:MAG: hypothetical protein ABI460_13090 [Caldimonas sp.]
MACLLACLVPLHGLAAGMIAAIGPAHSHKAMASIVLEDFRRAPAQITVLPTHVATAFGHFHAAGSSQRHHHARGDASVVLADGEALQSSGDGDDLGISPTLAMFVALLPSGIAWSPATLDAVAASHAPWVPETHHPALPERPPRAPA